MRGAGPRDVTPYQLTTYDNYYRAKLTQNSLLTFSLNRLILQNRVAVGLYF
jgi:hypothetical protein